MWRPKEGWNSKEMHLEMLRRDVDCMDGQAFIEAGADAMYEPAYQKGRSDEREELRARGLYGEYCEDFIVSSRVKPDEPDWAEAFFATLENKGTLVFIPEEE